MDIQEYSINNNKQDLTMTQSHLESLIPLDQVIVEQEIEMFEVFTGCESHNAYRIKTATGTWLFRAREDSNCCLRCICRTARPLTLHFEDIRGRDVLLFHRRLRCQRCICPCWLQQLDVEDPITGEFIGSVKQKWSFWGARLALADKENQEFGLVKGPCFRCGFVRFQVVSPTGEKLGIIQKLFSGFGQETVTDADNFSVSFPSKMSPTNKVILIAATFLIDYMYFEETEGNSCLFNTFCCCCCCCRNTKATAA